MDTVAAPGHVPDSISNFYTQGLDSFRRENFDACGMMMRKVIDITTKHFGYSTGGLYSRIESMKNAGAITADLAAWAHEIRDIGNDTAHEETPFSKKDAEETLKVLRNCF